MYATNEFRKGLKIELDGVPFEIVDFQHVSPGKGSAFTRTKLRNMLNKNQTERTFKSGDKVDRPNIEEKQMQYLYKDPEGYHFMVLSTYDQMTVPDDVIGETNIGYLQENLQVHVLFFNDRAIGISLPNFIEATVSQTEPSFRGDTVSGGGKPAKLSSGATVSVPVHIKEGDLIRVDTRDGSYVEKVNK